MTEGDYRRITFSVLVIRGEQGHEKEIADFVNSTVESMLTDGVQPEELEEARPDMQTYHRKHNKDNAYLLSILRVYDRYGLDLDSSYLETLNNLKDIHKNLRPLTNYRSLLMMHPE